MQYVVRLLVSFLLALPLTASCAELNTAIPDIIISSLEKIEGPERADETLNQARICLGSSPQLCRFLLQEANRYSNLINYDEGLARAYNGMGSVLNMVGDNSRALETGEQALRLHEKRGIREDALASHLEAVNLSRDLGNLY